MLKNYLKIAFRNLKRNKVYNFINIGGLAVGIACCVLLFLFVQNEWTYDSFHKKADRIFRVTQVSTQPDGSLFRGAAQSSQLALALESSFPGIQEAVRLISRQVQIADGQGNYIKGVDALFTDPAFFEFFTFPLLQGNPETALTDPNSVVLSKNAARKFFNVENAVGKILEIKIDETTLNLRVAGIVQNAPENSSIQFDIILPLKKVKYKYSGFFRKMLFDSWELGMFGTFVLLDEPGQAKILQTKLPAFVSQHYEDAKSENMRLRLQPLTAIHLNPKVSSAALTAPSDPFYSYLLGVIALLVLLIACINFTTLSLGRSAGRASEVGVRKAIGATKRQVRSQFWSEAILTSGAALIIGLILVRLLLPWFNQLAEKSLSLAFTPATILFLIALVIVTGLLAGSYPALVLSRFEPSRILQGNTLLGGKSRLTRTLVVAQFALSIALVISALIMSKQLGFVQTDLGFNQEQVVKISIPGSTVEGLEIYEPFKQEATRHEAIQSIAGASMGFFGRGMSLPLALSDTAEMSALFIPVSKTFIETLEIEMAAGRSFSPERSGIQKAVVNKAFVEALGWNEAVEKSFSAAGNSIGKAIGELQIIGVTENFHSQTMREKIEPVVLLPAEQFGGVSTIFARIAPGQISQGMIVLRNTWKDVVSDEPFEYQFLNEVVEAAYRDAQRTRSIIRYGAGFALLITCFGIFGLSMLATERRTKEIGVRKVMGATVTNIVGLLSKDFLKLVLISFVIAVPVAWYFMHQWLQDFAYRIDIGIGIFLLAGGLALFIALATVSWQSVRAALANPVDSLRSE